MQNTLFFKKMSCRTNNFSYLCSVIPNNKLSHANATNNKQ